MNRKIFIGLTALALAAITVAWMPAGALAESPALKVHTGEPAPDFTLLDQEGKPVTLSDFRGRWVVLYFYPKDDSPGCTTEACSFRDNLAAMQQLNAEILGISVDSVSSHKAFAGKFKLNFRILADADQKVCNQYGTLLSYGGKTVASRTTFILDPDGVVRRVFPSVDPKDHALEIHRALKELKGA